MTKTLRQINCDIFKILKEEELISYSKLPKMVGVDLDLILQSIGKLKGDHGLIFIKSQKLSLSEKGLKHKTFESYLESLNPKKEYWLNKYQMIYLSLFIFFGFFGIYKYFDSKDLKSQYETLKSEQKTLKSDFDVLKSKYDSVTTQKIELPKQIPNDSLQTKNISE